MANNRKGERKLFRQQALEQLSSPEQLDQLLQVTNRRSWLWILTLAGALVAAVVWSVLGQIPVTVDGIGILVYPRQVVSLQSPATGEIVSLDISVGDRIEVGQVIGAINQPDVAQRLEQERIRLAEAARPQPRGLRPLAAARGDGARGDQAQARAARSPHRHHHDDGRSAAGSD